MAQIKIYALNQTIDQFRDSISQAIHLALIDCLKLPMDKKFQRFIRLNEADFIFPNNRSRNYVIVEVLMFEGRSDDTKQQLIETIFTYISKHCSISSQDIEIAIFETPRSHWGIRGKNAAELELTYPINI